MDNIFEKFLYNKNIKKFENFNEKNLRWTLNNKRFGILTKRVHRYIIVIIEIKNI